MSRWHPRVASYRCPECNHYSNAEEIARIEELNKTLTCACCQEHPIPKTNRFCVCPCKCPNNDDPQDADYVFAEEADDNIVDSLTGKATSAEQQFARNYGWQTNVVASEDTDSERRMFYEAPGHHAVACMHDIGLPAESSLPNSENAIGRGSVDMLRKVLEPWELEAAQKTTGRTYDELCQTFPEGRRMQLPTGWTPPTEQAEPFTACTICNKPHSEEFVESLLRGVLTICSICGIALRPLNPADDPDFRDFNPSIRNVLEHCHCRCGCDPASLYSPSMEVDPAYSEAATMTEDFTNPLEEDPRPQTVQQGGRNVRSEGYGELWLPYDAPPSPVSVSSASPEELEEGEIEEYTPSSVVLALQETMRATNDLPELRFSRHSDWNQREIENITMALEDAETAQSFDEVEEALRYARFALDLSAYLPEQHPCQERARALTDELETLLDEAEESRMDLS